MFYSLFEKCSVFSDYSIDLQVFKIFEKKLTTMSRGLPCDYKQFFKNGLWRKMKA